MQVGQIQSGGQIVVSETGSWRLHPPQRRLSMVLTDGYHLSMMQNSSGNLETAAATFQWIQAKW
jgi:hypothetical protein